VTRMFVNREPIFHFFLLVSEPHEDDDFELQYLPVLLCNHLSGWSSPGGCLTIKCSYEVLILCIQRQY
jgi:hypothetical protein